MHPLYEKANTLSNDVSDAAMEVLEALGMGLLESVYERCLARELRLRGHRVETEKEVLIHYKGETFRQALRADLLVNDCLVVELKSIEAAIRLEHRMQVLSYMRLLGYPLGLLINFGAVEGKRIHRVILKGADAQGVNAAEDRRAQQSVPKGVIARGVGAAVSGANG